MKTSQCFVAALLISLTPAAAKAGSCPAAAFQQAKLYDAIQDADGVVVGQFTADDIPDLAFTAGGSSRGVAVLPGVGDGTFLAPITTDLFSDTDILIAADFNGDQKTDLAFRNSVQEVGVLLSNGDGTFGPPTTYFTPGLIFGLAAADLTGTGKIDIIVSFNDSFIVVLPANGDGTFGDAAESSIGEGRTGAIAVADLDGDGKPDLVSAVPGGVAVSHGNGDRTFGPTRLYPVAPLISSIAIADVDGDGHPDIGVTVPDYNEVKGRYVGILLGHGDGTFEAALETYVGQNPTSLAFADLDGDGHVEGVAVAAGMVAVVGEFGVGGFASVAHYVTAGANKLAVGDLNGDGKPDVATASTSTTVLLNNGDGSLLGSRGIATGNDQGITDFLVADFNGDGFGDVVAAGQAGVLIFDGVPGGLDSPRILVDSSVNPVALAAADFNADGFLDVAVNANVGLLVFLGHGDGVFEAPKLSPVAAFNPGKMVTADFNGDGHVDIALANNNSGAGGITVAFGVGDGTFQGAASTPLDFFPLALALGDYNGDGKPDLAVIVEQFQSDLGRVRVLLGLGDGSFEDHADYETPKTPWDIASGELSGGGGTDLLVSDGDAGLLLLVGHGDGTFDPPASIPIDHFVVSAAIADFDGDGVLDIVTSNGVPISNDGASFLKGTGGGGFASPTNFFVSSQNRSAAAFPLRGTAPDALIESDNGTVSILTNARLTASVASRNVIVGSPAVLKASASGFGGLTYQWRKNGVPLSDGGPISGVTTATLTIDPVAFTDAGSYDVVVTDSCGSAPSNTATLAVEFDDVPLDNPFHADILTIATAGITGGCTDTSYCPSNPVSRAEMAVFLLKSKYGADHVPPPPPPDPIFPDVPADAFAAAWIDELATLEITTGCGDGLYCPDRSVSRAEMAVFLLKTLLGSGYVPPAPAGLFADVPLDYFAIAWIEDLYNRGVTAGCATNPLRYCPDAIVPREQMATFLVRTFLGP